MTNLGWSLPSGCADSQFDMKYNEKQPRCSCGAFLQNEFSDVHYEDVTREFETNDESKIPATATDVSKFKLPWGDYVWVYNLTEKERYPATKCKHCGKLNINFE